MKSNLFMQNPLRTAVALAASVLAMASTSMAADIIKADNTNNLDQTTSWVGGAVPGQSDVGVWDSTVTGANTTLLGSSATWDGIRIANPAGPVSIGAGSTLTLGASGIDMSSATQDLSMTNGVTLPSGVVQTWDVPSGRTLALEGALNRAQGAGILHVNGSGTIHLNGSILTNTTLLYALINGTDLGCTDASTNISTIAATRGYTPVGSANVSANYTLQEFIDMDNSTTATGTAADLSMGNKIGQPRVLRFNTPHPSGRGYWLVAAGTGQLALRQGVNAFLFTTNLGANDVNFTGTSHTLRWASSSPGCELILDQQNTAGTVYFSGAMSEKNHLQGDTVLKSGAGRVVFNVDPPYYGPTRILEGELTINGNLLNSSSVVINSGATLSGAGVIKNLVTNNGTIWPGYNGAGLLKVGNLTFNSGSALKFYAATVPTTNATALLDITNTAVVVNGSVDVSIVSGGMATGQYPLIHAVSAFSAPDFANFNLAVLPPHVTAYLSNNTANASIDLVVDSVNTPLVWTNSSATWDLASANWQDQLGAGTSYQELNGLGDSVLFEDTLSGSSPITVTLNSTVHPSATTVSNITKTYSISGSGSIAGAGNLTKEGSGTLTLGTANTFTGGINLNGGTTVFSALDNLGAGDINFGGGTLQYASGNTADISAQTVTLGAGGATIDVGGNNVTFANAIGNGGAGGLTKAGSGSLTLSGANNYSGDTLINAGTLALANSGTLSNSPNIVLSSGTLFDVYNNGGYTLSATAGQALSGEGFVNGGLTVPAGTTISPATSSTTGSLFITNFSTLDISGTLELNVTTTSGSDYIEADYINVNPGAVITVPGAALTNGYYKLIQANYSFSGSLTYFSFALGQAGKSGSLVLVNEGGSTNALYLVVSDLASDDITWSGAGYLWDASTANWFVTSTANPWVFTNGDIVRFDETGAAYPSVNVEGVVKPSLVVVSNPVTAYAFYENTSGSKFGGSASLLKLGAASLSINTVNENSGGTTIQEGTVNVYGSLGSGPVTNNAELVLIHNAPQTIASITGTGALTQSGANTTVAGAADYTGPTTITGGTLQFGSGGPEGVLSTSAITNNGTMILNSSTDWTNNISDTGSGALVKDGTNTLTLSGPITRTGETRVNAGKMVLGNANQLSAGSARVEAGGKLDINGNDQLVLGLNSTIFSGGLIVNNAGGLNILTCSNNVDADCSATINDNEGSGGSIAFVKQGTAKLEMRGANGYTGGTTIEAGTVRITSATPFGVNTNPVHMKGAVLTYGNSSSMGYLNPTYIDPSINGTTNTIGIGSGGFPGTPLIGTEDLVFDFATGGNNDTFSPYGTMFDNLTNTIYLVGTGGWLRFDTVANLRGVTIDFRDSAVTINANKATDIYIGGVRGGTNAVFDDSEARNHIVGFKNQNDIYSGRLRGNFSFTKVGTGTWTWNGTGYYVATNVAQPALTYSGSTTVSNGTLHLTAGANPTNSSGFQIAAGALLDISGMGYQVFETNELDQVTNTYTAVTDTLDLGLARAQTLSGSGTLRGSVVAYTNSTINPGDGIGTLTVETNVTLGGALVLELNRTNTPANCDQLVAGGTLTIGGTLTVNNVGPELQGGDTFQLFPAAVAESSFTATNLPALTGVKYWVDNLAVDGSISVVDPINPNPPVIQVSVSGATFSLGWPTNAGWILQSNSVSLSDSAAWFEYPPSGSGSLTNVDISIDPNNPNVFFRMVKP